MSGADTCLCGHPGQLHVPGGGPCTAASGGCDCHAFLRRTRLPDEHLTVEEVTR